MSMGRGGTRTLDRTDGPLRVTQDYRDRWADRILAGASVSEVARAAGVTPRTARRWARLRREAQENARQ